MKSAKPDGEPVFVWTGVNPSVLQSGGVLVPAYKAAAASVSSGAFWGVHETLAEVAVMFVTATERLGAACVPPPSLRDPSGAGVGASECASAAVLGPSGDPSAPMFVAPSEVPVSPGLAEGAAPSTGERGATTGVCSSLQAANTSDNTRGAAKMALGDAFMGVQLPAAREPARSRSLYFQVSGTLASQDIAP